MLSDNLFLVIDIQSLHGLNLDPNSVLPFLNTNDPNNVGTMTKNPEDHNPRPFERLHRRPSLTDDISAQLSKKILEGDLKPGERLPTEQALSDSFGVARTVVREAISRLKHDGLVDSKQGIGAFVNTAEKRTAFRISPACFEKRKKLLEILQMQTGLTAQAASMAAELRTSEQLEAMQLAFDEMEAASSLDFETAEKRLNATRRLYVLIAEASTNQQMVEFLAMLDDRITRELHSPAVKNAMAVEWGEKTLTEHKAVLTAIENKDASAAARAARIHFTNAAERLANRADLFDL